MTTKKTWFQRAGYPTRWYKGLVYARTGDGSCSNTFIYLNILEKTCKAIKINVNKSCHIGCHGQWALLGSPRSWGRWMAHQTLENVLVWINKTSPSVLESWTNFQKLLDRQQIKYLRRTDDGCKCNGLSLVIPCEPFRYPIIHTRKHVLTKWLGRCNDWMNFSSDKENCSTKTKWMKSSNKSKIKYVHQYPLTI